MLFSGVSKPHGRVAGNGNFLTKASKPCGAWMTELGCSSSSDLGLEAWAAAFLVSSCVVISAVFASQKAGSPVGVTYSQSRFGGFYGRLRRRIVVFGFCGSIFYMGSICVVGRSGYWGGIGNVAGTGWIEGGGVGGGL